LNFSSFWLQQREFNTCAAKTEIRFWCKPTFDRWYCRYNYRYTTHGHWHSVTM